MRADLCAALLHNPQILFLDEPTIGLDVVVKKQIRDMIKKINEVRKVTVILTTHDMKDVEEVFIDGYNLRIKFDPAKTSSAEIVTALVKQCNLVNIQVHEPEIDDIIMYLYQKE